MTIEKRKNTWRITQMHKGTIYRVTLDHKPNKAEAMKLIAAEIDRPTAAVGIKFKDAGEAYIAAKDRVLSPCTVRAYRNMLRKLPESFLRLSVSEVGYLDVQKQINALAVNLSPKTVQNYSSFILSVLKSYDIDLKSPKLPQKEKKAPYIPTEDEVRQVMTAAEGTAYEVPFKLAALGLRRSEICAATPADLDEDNVLHITKALVPNDSGEYVVKKPKTVESTRSVPLPASLAARIREDGKIYLGNPNSLTKALYRIQDDLGLQHFSIHKLRHFFASFMHGKYTEAQIMEMGGWKTNTVLTRIYTHAMDVDAAKRRMSEDIGAIF